MYTCFILQKKNMSQSHENHIKHLKQTVKVANRAMSMGRHPFGAILVGPENQILAEQGNINTLNHAENTLCRVACKDLSIKV